MIAGCTKPGYAKRTAEIATANAIAIHELAKTEKSALVRAEALKHIEEDASILSMSLVKGVAAKGLSMAGSYFGLPAGLTEGALGLLLAGLGANGYRNRKKKLVDITERKDDATQSV